MDHEGLFPPCFESFWIFTILKGLSPVLLNIIPVIKLPIPLPYSHLGFFRRSQRLKMARNLTVFQKTNQVQLTDCNLKYSGILTEILPLHHPNPFPLPR
jgi:hypothetical protein